MKIIADNKDEKVLSMEKNGYTVNFTLLDMGIYVGHMNREWYEDASPYWETMFIEVKSEDPSKCLKAEILINSNGGFQRLIISDNNGNTRVINSLGFCYYEDHRLRSRGNHSANHRELLNEMYVEKVPGDVSDIGKAYYYDEKSGKFIDDTGIEAPDSILTNKEIGDLFRSAATSLSKQFRSKESVAEITDVDFEI